MKNIVKISALIMILLAGISSSDMNAQRGRGMRGIRNDSTFVMNDSLNRPMAGRRMAMMNNQAMSSRMRSFNGMMPYMMLQMRGQADGRMRQPMFSYGHNRSGMVSGRMGQAMNNAPGRQIMVSMPGVTLKQKEALEAINKEQQEEMQKLREKHQEAIKVIRDNHRKKVEDLLTDEQKKWMEENASPQR